MNDMIRQINFAEGWVQTPAEAKLVSDWENRQRENAVSRMLKNCIPEGCENQTFGTYICETEQQEKILHTARKAAELVRSGKFVTLCLLGNYGIGKTHIAVSMMDDVIRHGILEIRHPYVKNGEEREDVFEVIMSARYLLVPELMERYGDATSYTSRESRTEVIKDAVDADFIVLDEIGRWANPAEEKEVLYRIFNECWTQKKSVVAISNMNMQEFTKHLGGATMDRLKDSAVFPRLDDMEGYRGRN